MIFAKKNNKKYLFLGLLALFVAGVLTLFKLDKLEKEAPVIYAEDTIYYNLKEPLVVRVADELSTLSSVKISLQKSENDNATVIFEKKGIGEKEFLAQFMLPKTAFKEQINAYILSIEASDNSWWNFFSGNKALKKVQILIDDKSPKIDVLSASYQISRGGAASVVFSVKDENLKEVFLEAAGHKFVPVSYLKEGFFASLIAWDVMSNTFEAFIIAKDKAGNESRLKVPIYLQNRKYKDSKIALSDKFLDGKIKELSELYAPRGSNLSRLEQFKFVNETLRLGNEKLIHEVAIKESKQQGVLSEFKLNLFLPLKNAMKVADFADHRFYSYDGQFVSDSYHLGLDLASVAKATIITNNGGKIVLARENGIYGTNVMINHGFGLFTLYGHCTQSFVAEGEQVSAVQNIASTGVSGLALGDHLHFGVLVQGVEVRPEEWQDRKWIQNNISKVLEEGRKIILGK